MEYVFVLFLFANEKISCEVKYYDQDHTAKQGTEQRFEPRYLYVSAQRNKGKNPHF